MVEPITELYCYSGIMKPWVPVAVRHLQILRTLDFLPMGFHPFTCKHTLVLII